MRYPKGSPEQLTAPQGKFRLIAIDLRDGLDSEYCLGDFETFELAKGVAEQKGGVGHPVYIYNDGGELVVRYGSWH